jgi:hypothetical protein
VSLSVSTCGDGVLSANYHRCCCLLPANLPPISYAADYLVVITKRKKVATVLSTPVYAATDFSVFPLERSTSVALLAQPDEAYLLGLLKAHLYSAPFYFTYGGNFDVTTRLQYQKRGQPLFEAVSSQSSRHLAPRLWYSYCFHIRPMIDSSGIVIFNGV